MRAELLAPAGSPAKLRFAVAYGANAVYCAGPSFGLRTASQNFTEEELASSIEFAHQNGVKVYITVNIYPKEDELFGISNWLKKLKSLGADAVIVSDAGIMDLAVKAGLELHVSTQANTTNSGAARMWHNMGASRIVLARETSIAEIAKIRSAIPSDLEIEAFVHGAMCVSYSGRCLLSNYLAGRDANAGDCTQPCRWKYALMEEKRPGVYLPIEEDDRGTYIMNSRDLCLIRRLPELEAAGVSSFKIEGRVKSEFYLATVTGAYRRAMDNGFSEDLYEEVCKVSHREYFEGFADGAPSRGDGSWQGQIHQDAMYIRTHEYIAHVVGYEEGRAACRMRGRLRIGDSLEALTPSGVFSVPVTALWNERGVAVDEIKSPDALFYIATEHNLPSDSLLRRPQK